MHAYLEKVCRLGNKMDVKDFFKPTIAKIVATIAIFASFILAPIYPHEECMTIVGGGCETFYDSFMNFPWHLSGEIVTSILIALLIATYLTSCTVIFACNKLKR